MNKQTTEIKENEKKGGCCCAGKNQHQSEGADRSVQSNDSPLHTLAVKGATCGGCVEIIEGSLQSVAGVVEARMNLSTGIAIVSGDVAVESLISTLENVGFSAVKAEKHEVKD